MSTEVCFKGGAAPLDPPLLRRALAAHAAEGSMTRLRVLSILTGFCSTLELVYRVVPDFCPTLTFELIHNGQTHSCYYIGKVNVSLKNLVSNVFFCYGLKLYDFLNVYHFFVTKVTFEWLLSIMSSRSKKEKVNLHSNIFFIMGSS